MVLGTLFLVNGLMNCHVERGRDISRSVEMSIT